MIVGIHQPNYLPWLGYFYKIMTSDIFVFLDDAQFSKNSITNRVSIAGDAEPRWLTVPVRAKIGQRINEVLPAQDDWRSRNLSLLRNVYGKARRFSAMWPEISEWFDLPVGVEPHMAGINSHFIMEIARGLGVKTRFVNASALGIEGKSDDRLIAIVRHLAPSGVYLSGRGGAKYQDPEKFSAAGIELAYTNFTALPYPQGRAEFQAGLSIVDALFHLGWDGVLGLLRDGRA